jgi:hypothetical protein
MTMSLSALTLFMKGWYLSHWKLKPNRIESNMSQKSHWCCRVMKELPHYAAPLFLRVSEQVEITNTFKYKKVNLVKEGFDPNIVKVKFFTSTRKFKVILGSCAQFSSPTGPTLFSWWHCEEVRSSRFSVISENMYPKSLCKIVILRLSKLTLSSHASLEYCTTANVIMNKFTLKVIVWNKPKNMSQVFYPFRAIGLYCDSIPFALQKRGSETFIATSIEKTFQIYNVSHVKSEIRERFWSVTLKQLSVFIKKWNVFGHFWIHPLFVILMWRNTKIWMFEF